MMTFLMKFPTKFQSLYLRSDFLRNIKLKGSGGMNKIIEQWPIFVGIVVVSMFLNTIQGDVRVLRAEVTGSFTLLKSELKSMQDRILRLEEAK